jgi:hypothetical protein
MQSITANYRNEACRALAEKVNRREASDTLNVKLNIQLDRSKRDPAMVDAIMKCMQGRREFVMYQDKRNYTMFIPAYRLAVCVKNGEEYEWDIAKDDEEYIARLKMAMVGYDHFFEPLKQIEIAPGKTLIYV